MNKLSLIVLVLCAGCAGQAPRSDEPNRLADNPYCVHDTGSHMAAAKGRCVPGRTYTREEVGRTGGATLSDALRSLTPF